MDQIKRFAVYYAPPAGDFADVAAAWLGWDAALGCAVQQPDLGLPAAEITTEPRKYGFMARSSRPSDWRMARARRICGRALPHWRGNSRRWFCRGCG